MRLINTKTLKLEEFFDDRIPEYAILSHTWGLDEVSFQDMQSGNAIGKAGYRKIDLCCTESRFNGYPYAWIDTCCIDKSSSAELSEAINSMYQWYKRARICYVFLEDIKVAPGTVVVDNWIRESSFSKCRWFTRGWTLQELIASTYIRFFDHQWRSLGTKETLRDMLAAATGIDVEVLSGSTSLTQVPVAKRMSWASKRQTTRTEDIAYCLLGIFDVNMPLLYGEGSKAFLRLLEEILKSSDDHSIFVWKEPEDLSTSVKTQTGMLPSSPKQYEHSDDAIPFRTWGESVPYTMTNKGLSIELDIAEKITMEGTTDYEIGHFGILNCWMDKDSKNRAAVRLQWLEGDQYARISSSQIWRATPQPVKTKSIFVRNSVTVRAKHDQVHSGVKYTLHFSDFNFEVRDSLQGTPRERLDLFRMCFFASADSESGGVLKFPFAGHTVFMVLGWDMYTREGWVYLKANIMDQTMDEIFAAVESCRKAELKSLGWMEELPLDPLNILTVDTQSQSTARSSEYPGFDITVRHRVLPRRYINETQKNVEPWYAGLL